MADNIPNAGADANVHKPPERKEEKKQVDTIILAHYNLNANGLPVEVNIKQTSEFVPIYDVTFPGIGVATKLLLLSLRNDLLGMVTIDTAKIQNQEYLNELTKRVMASSSILIDKYLPGTSDATKILLASYMRNMMLGLGDLEAPLADENLEELAVNGSREPIWVFHKKIGWCKTNIKMPSEEAIYETSEMIGRRVGREINNLAPLMDAELGDGSRVNATLFPISNFGNTITIRKFEKNPWTMPALVRNGTISPQVAGLVWLCIQNEISLLISGGTASGKTSFLNASSIFFPANRRVISVEETRELSLPKFYQWVSMITRRPNPEGKGEISLYDLMVNALRQRPDIMLVGEVRTGKDAETLFEAIHTGHAVYGTVHADNAQDTIIRMTNPPIDTPKIMINAIGGIIVAFRHRSKSIRRILEFAEIMRTGDANTLYRWSMRNDTFNQVGDMLRLHEVIGLYGGLNMKEIEDEIAEKAKILLWMVKHDVTSVDDAAFVVSNYYKNKEKVIDIVKNDVDYSQNLF
jgi:archaeal flagellar protein FlaI